MDTNSHECFRPPADLWSVKTRGSHAPSRSAAARRRFFQTANATAGTEAVASTVKKRVTAHSGELSRQLGRASSKRCLPTAASRVKANVSSTTKAHLIRGAVYLLLLLAVGVIPFALGQRPSAKRNTSANTAQPPITSAENERHAVALPTPEFPTGGAIYSQYDNPATKPPLGIGSQKFEPAMAAFDDQAADDFLITAPPPPIFLYITGVRVMGDYSEGGGPASSFNVYIYANGAGNLPGAGIASFLNLPYTGTPPDFVIHWSPFSLLSGTYWVSVQAVQNFNPNGQWFWHNRTVQSNVGAAWRNPGHGYGTGCTNWNRKNACMADQVWPDQVFEILGFVEGPTPTATVTPTATPTPTPTGSPSPIACALFEDFDNVTPPTLPVGWIASNAINPDGILWQTSNSGLPSPPADTLPNAAWVNDPSAVSDKRLDSPPVRIELLENAILTFRNNYAFQKIFDGGVLEISIDNGVFQDIVAAGGTFLQGGYNGSISTCCGNPLAGRQAWIGSGPAFTTTTVDMGAFQGHTIVLRWRMGSDNSLSGLGWRIDTVQMLCERPTPTATPAATCCQYMPSTGAGIIEPGTTDIGNHCDNCTTTVPLPFTVYLYGQIPTGVASVSSNGNLQFVNQLPYAGTSCPLPDLNLGTAILPYQDDIRTDQVADCSVFTSGCGVFTSTTGTAPNRAFNIEWRAAYSGRSGTANFEVRFYENQNSFDIFYGATADNGGSEESGVQAGVSVGCPATTFSCHTPSLTNGLRVTYTCGPPFTPTPTATATVTATPTANHSATATPTATPCPTVSPTPSDTPTPTPIAPRVTPTARPRPSPRP